MLPKLFVVCMLVLAQLVGLLPICKAAAEVKPIFLKTITAMPRDHPTYPAWWWFVDQVSKQSEGKIRIQYVGGPEAIPTFDQPEALRSGVVDLSLNIGGYYEKMLPEALAIQIAQTKPWEDRESGAYDIFVELHKKALNAYYLGTTYHPSAMQMYSNVRIEKVEDFRGLKFRGGGSYVYFMDALGTVQVTVAPADIYTSLERNMIDGTPWSRSGLVERGWAQVLKYIVGPPFWRSSNTILINLDTWNRIPERLQKLMKDLVAKQERDWYSFYEDYDKAQLKQMLDAKMKVIEFSRADNERYLELAYRSGWDALVKKSPQYGPRLRKMLTK